MAVLVAPDRPALAPQRNELREGMKSIVGELLNEAGLSATGYKHDASGTPITTGYSHGNGGNFRLPGVDPQLFHTIVGNKGILGQLPVRGTTETDPTYGIITGVTDDTGSEPDAVCDTAPVAGLLKNCVTAAPFGRYTRRTKEIELTRLGKTADRADPMDLRMIGTPISQSGLFLTGPGSAAVPGDLLTNETNRKFWEMGISIHRLISKQLWTGSTANNTGAGGYMEINGFERLVRTGYQDVITQTACPSVDAQVMDLNYARVDTSGPDIVDSLSYTIRYAEDLAERTGVTPVRWVLAMRQEMFYELTAIWPCAYLTYRCALAGNERLNIDGAEQVRMTNEMRNGRYLLVDGRTVEVVFDDGIPQATSTTNANVTEGCFSSDIYLIPMSIAGGIAVTYLEHMDYGNASLSTALGDSLVQAQVEGPWLTVLDQTRTCIAWQTVMEPRLVMRTPWLSAVIQNVMACPLKSTRQPFPSDPYYVNGGETGRAGPSYYALWNS